MKKKKKQLTTEQLMKNVEELLKTKELREDGAELFEKVIKRVGEVKQGKKNKG